MPVEKLKTYLGSKRLVQLATREEFYSRQQPGVNKIEKISDYT